jgi:hypothetical protein
VSRQNSVCYTYKRTCLVPILLASAKILDDFSTTFIEMGIWVSLRSSDICAGRHGHV